MSTLMPVPADTADSRSAFVLELRGAAHLLAAPAGPATESLLTALAPPL